MAVTLVAGDTATKLKATLKDSGGVVINLTGATVKLGYKIANGSYQSRTMTLVDAVNGVVSYQFQSGDLVVGDLIGEIEITFSDGTVVTSAVPFSATVRMRVFGKPSANVARLVVINAITFQSINGSGSPLPLGTPIYFSSQGVMKPAQANVQTNVSDVEGMIIDQTVAANALGNCFTRGIITGTVSQWSAITGDPVGLVAGTDYYLSPAAPGKLVTATFAFVSGQVVLKLGSALSDTAFDFEIGQRIML